MLLSEHAPFKATCPFSQDGEARRWCDKRMSGKASAHGRPASAREGGVRANLWGVPDVARGVRGITRSCSQTL
ncbi:hypothetical protein Acsp03_23520 [Actinomadura sp. NBRC 104412]|nr:hypothetical protein Acsp03_23520 [Actinomadura sp. NBRC 104412]